MKLRTLLLIALVLFVGLTSATAAGMNRQKRAGTGFGAGQSTFQNNVKNYDSDSPQTCIYYGTQIQKRNGQVARPGGSRQAGNGNCLRQCGNRQGRNGQGGNGKGRNGQGGNGRSRNGQGGNGQGRGGQGGNRQGYNCNGICIYQ